MVVDPLHASSRRGLPQPRVVENQAILDEAEPGLRRLAVVECEWENGLGEIVGQTEGQNDDIRVETQAPVHQGDQLLVRPVPLHRQVCGLDPVGAGIQQVRERLLVGDIQAEGDRVAQDDHSRHARRL